MVDHEFDSVSVKLSVVKVDHTVADHHAQEVDFGDVFFPVVGVDSDCEVGDVLASV